MAQGPPLVVPQATQIKLGGATANGAYMNNVLHAINPGGVTINQALANTLDTAIKSAWTTHLAPHSSANSALFFVSVRDLRAANLAEYVGTGALVAGSGVGDPLPGSVALVISLKTAKAGASFRGRVYLGGFTEAENDTTGEATTALGAAGVAFVTAVQTSLTSAGLQLAVLSRPAYATQTTKVTTAGSGASETETHSTRARAGEINPVTAILAKNTIWDSQRRRGSAGSSSTLFRQPVAATYLD